jgi:hypothetical protein
VVDVQNLDVHYEDDPAADVLLHGVLWVPHELEIADGAMGVPTG